MEPEHPNEESLLDSTSEEDPERLDMDDLVPDGMVDDQNIEDPADSEAAEEAAVRLSRSTRVG